MAFGRMPESLFNLDISININRMAAWRGCRLDMLDIIAWLYPRDGAVRMAVVVSSATHFSSSAFFIGANF